MKFGTIYADPPWPYNNGTPRGGVDREYRTTSIDDLCAMRVGDLAADDGCLLWMWATWSMMRDGNHLRLLDAWGFKWRSEMVWDKQAFGLGYWMRKQTEILIVASKNGGKLRSKTQRDLVSVHRSSHSSKPWVFYEIIERCSPGPFIELFARSEGELCPRRSGWVFWGDQGSDHVAVLDGEAE